MVNFLGFSDGKPLFRCNAEKREKAGKEKPEIMEKGRKSRLKKSVNHFWQKPAVNNS